MSAREERALAKGLVDAREAADAADRIAAALARGKTPKLEDAKILEAVGCWTRRAIARGVL